MGTIFLIFIEISFSFWVVFYSYEIMLVPLVTLLSGIGAWYDIRTRKIPNTLILIGFLVLLSLMLYHLPWGDWPWHLMSFAMGAVLGIGSFYLGVMGGGDGKLLMLVSLAVPFEQWKYLVLSIALVGGIQAIIYWCLHKTKAGTMPYGVAIFLGTLLFYLWLRMLSNGDLWGV